MQQDPCAVLPAELFHKCILLIPNHVRRVTRVSRRWKSVLESSSWLWKELSQIPLEIRSKNLLDEPILYNSWCIDSNLASAASEGRMLSQELIQMTRLFEDPADLIVSCMGCSSQDHQEQGIEQTVDHSQITFWSSIGTLHNMADHYLEYELVRGGCVVSQIEIKPFLARYQPGLPIYAPKYVSFYLSWHRDFTKVHFKSKRFPMENVNETQVFKLEPVQRGRYLRIYLHKQITKQPGDALYYTCIESVRVGGGLTGYSSDLKRPDFPILNSLFQFDDAGVEQMSYNEWKKANDIKLHCIALVRAGQLTRLLQHMQLLPPNSPVRQQRFLDFFWAELPKNSESPIKWFKSYIKSLYSIEKQLTRDESIQVAKYTCAYNGFKLTLIERGIQLRLVQCTHELGNIFYSAGSLNLAHLIFDVGQVIDGLIDCTLAIGRYKVAAVFVADFYPPQMFESFLKIARNKHPVKNLHSFIEYFLQLIQQVRFDSWNRDQILFLANRYL